MGIIRDRFNKIVAVEYKANTLNNVNDVSMLNLEDGECSQLLNVDIIDDGAVQRRKGYVSVLTGNIHSGWSSQTKDIAYFVQDSILYSFNGTTKKAVVALSNNSRCVFCEVNDIVIYSNNVDFGIIENAVNVLLTAPTEPFKVAPVAGQCLEFYNGRLYIGSGNIVYCTDPYNLEQMDERFCVVLEATSRITMVRRTDDGLFIGTEKEIFFLKGADQQEGSFEQVSVAAYGCIYGTDCFINGEYLKDGSIAGTAVLFSSTRGICLGSNGGAFRNISQTYYTPIFGEEGSALIRFKDSQVHYIANTNVGTEAFNHNAQPTFDVDSIEA